MLCVVHHVSAFEIDMTKRREFTGKGHNGTFSNENSAASCSVSDFRRPAHAATPAPAIPAPSANVR